MAAVRTLYIGLQWCACHLLQFKTVIMEVSLYVPFMSYDKSEADHYLHGNFLDAIKIVFLVMGKTIKTETIEDLAAVDDFNVGEL